MFEGQTHKYELSCTLYDGKGINRKRLVFDSIEGAAWFVRKQRAEARLMHFICFKSIGGYILARVPNHVLLGHNEK